MNELIKTKLPTKLTVCYTGGSDHAVKCGLEDGFGLYKMNDIFVCVIQRPNYLLSYVGDKTFLLDLTSEEKDVWNDLSSTQVQKLCKSTQILREDLEKLVHHDVASYMFAHSILGYEEKKSLEQK